MSDLYLEEFLRPLRTCLKYKPKFGADKGFTDLEFLDRFRDDFFYRAVGLATREMYVAHKAAGGITSFYRQLGVACEVLTRSVLMNELKLPSSAVKWHYELATGNGKDRTLKLDARIAPAEIADSDRREAVQNWLVTAARQTGVADSVAQASTGAVFEVRQGYKSADSKRQNADLSFAIHAYQAGYLPCLMVFSAQVSQSVTARYKKDGMYVLLGGRSEQANMDTRKFFSEVIGWDLEKWLEERGPAIQEELTEIIKYLLR